MITLASRDVIPIGPMHLGLSALLVIVAGLVSLLLRLKLERQLVIASIRTVVQLLLVGLILRKVFELNSLPAIGAIAIIMIGTAAVAATRRPARSFRGVSWLAFGTLILTGLLTTYCVTGVIIRADPWYKPQYLIPLLGMILGNALNGISICIDQLLESLTDKRHEVEMELAHGATAWEAARDPVRNAVRRGMIPIINSMMVVGIVSLPGMMTGLILDGADPMLAVKYQIVVMFMICAATSLGSIGIALLVFNRLFNERHQLRTEIIRKRST